MAMLVADIIAPCLSLLVICLSPDKLFALICTAA